MALGRPKADLVVTAEEREARSHATRAADAPRASRATHARLHTPRHQLALRRPRREGRDGPRRVSPATSERRLPALSRHDRCQRPAHPRCASDPRRLRHAQDRAHPSLIHRWLAKRPRFHLHFNPTSASWLNLVERWFAALTEKWLRRGSHRSTRQLEEAIAKYLSLTNRTPKPFVWTKPADEILESVARFCQRTSDSGH